MKCRCGADLIKGQEINVFISYGKLTIKCPVCLMPHTVIIDPCGNFIFTSFNGEPIKESLPDECKKCIYDGNCNMGVDKSDPCQGFIEKVPEKNNNGVE